MNTTKILVGLIVTAAMLIITITGASAIDDCAIKNLCYNQDDKPYCSPQDENCTYRYYELSEDTCVISTSITDADTDNDGWSNNCDAFKDNETEWIDLDGDGTGDNADCEPLNPEIACNDEENSTGDEEQNDDSKTEQSDDENEKSDDSPSGSGSSTKKTSTLDNDGVVRIVHKDAAENVDDLDNDGNVTMKNETISITNPEETTKDDEKELIPDVVKEAQKNQLTGMVAGDENDRTSFSKGFYWLLAIAVLTGLFFLIYKKKKKEE